MIKIVIYVIIVLGVVGCKSQPPGLLYLTTHLHQLEQENTAKEKRIEDLLKSSAMQVVYDQNLVIKAEVRKLNKRTRFLRAIVKIASLNLAEEMGGGIDPQTGKLNQPMKVAGVAWLFEPDDVSKKGFKLKQRLDAYVDYLNEEFGAYGMPALPKFTSGNLNNPLYAYWPQEKAKYFAQTYFRDTPVIMALVYLAHFEAIVLGYQEEVIRYFLLHTITLTSNKNRK